MKTSLNVRLANRVSQISYRILVPLLRFTFRSLLRVQIRLLLTEALRRTWWNVCIFFLGLAWYSSRRILHYIVEEHIGKVRTLPVIGLVYNRLLTRTLRYYTLVPN